MNEQALVEALRQRTIAGAALDVFAQEPLEADSPLYRLDNIIVTPHVSGAFGNMFVRVVTLFLENLERYQSGKKLFNFVDRQRGY